MPARKAKAKTPAMPGDGTIRKDSIVLHKRLKQYGRVLKPMGDRRPDWYHGGPAQPQVKVAWFKTAEEGRPMTSTVITSSLRKVA